jgi:hypothetical protein
MIISVRNTSKKTQLGSAHFGFIALSMALILGTVGYVFWTNILQPKLAQRQQLSGVSAALPDVYSDRHAPITFNHPKGWTLNSQNTGKNDFRIYARTNEGRVDEKVVFELFYNKNYPNTNPNVSNRRIAEGLSLIPHCPLEVSVSAPSDCKLVKNSVTSGYVYTAREKENTHVVRWYGQTKNKIESMNIKSYGLSEATLGAIISSIKSSPSRAGMEVLVSQNSVNETDRAANDLNAKIANQAEMSLSFQKCDEIQGFIYEADPYAKDKIRVYEEWQALIECRSRVQAAIKKDKGRRLLGDDCSKLKQFPGLRRILENVEVLSARDGRVALVKTNDGNKSVSYAEKYYESPITSFVDTTCEPGGSLNIKVGDMISVYVPVDDKSPSAFEHNTSVVQRVNNFE